MPDPVTVHDYWLNFRDMARTFSVQVGFDIRTADQQTRCLASVTGAQFALMTKLMVDKGYVTWAEVTALYADALGEAWERESALPPPPDLQPGDPGTVSGDDGLIEEP